ncbi:MAG: putative transposase [Rhodothermales bacterium]|jgi:putative transposase
MSKNTIVSGKIRHHAALADPLTEVLRTGARELLGQAIRVELEALLEETSSLVTESGHRRIVRNGYLPERTVQTGIGPVDVKVPRVRDRAPTAEGTITFTPTMLPRYLRKSRSLEALIPWLYLKGISTGQFGEALTALLGPGAPGLSSTTISRLKAGWQQDLESWQKRDLRGKRYLYWWADGVYFNVRMEEASQCVLVIIGVTEDGTKELVAVTDGYRESTASWREIFLDLKQRGLELAPKVATGDGALGFWSALAEQYPTTTVQRCWVHKIANVLNALPKSMHGKAKAHLRDIYRAETAKEADKAFAYFLAAYQPKYPKAAETLRKDREALLAFYAFPAEHWVSLRTTNPIESTFSTVRLRTNTSRGCFSRATVLTMVFQLMRSAQNNWRRLNAPEHLTSVAKNILFIDGIHPAKIAA